jgi:hypothetical protein
LKNKQNVRYTHISSLTTIVFREKITQKQK